MEDIIKKIYSHYLSDKELLEKEKEILMLNDLKKLDFEDQKVNLYYNNNYFIKITCIHEYTKEYKLTNNYLIIDKFPLEIIINNILRKELPNNIVKFNNYYFNNSKQILVMENAGNTFRDLLISNINNLELINTKIYEIIIILAIFEDKFKFMHKDLHYKNIIMKKTQNEYNMYNLHGKEYKIKSYGYIPVIIDFGTCMIFKLYNKEFIIKREIKKNNNLSNKFKNLKIIKLTDFNDYITYVRRLVLYIPSLDIFKLFVSIQRKFNNAYSIPIIKEYIDMNNIKNFEYSPTYLSPFEFLQKYKN